MTIFKVAYMPEFTKEFHALMNEYMHPSMESSDSSTQQLELSQIFDTIQEEGLSLNDTDKQLLKDLDNQEVAYIEIKTRYSDDT